MAIDWQPLLKIVDRYERFVITSHVRPDADAIGSEIGLAMFLQQRGKQVRIINPSPTPEHLKFLDPQGLAQKIGGPITVESACDTDVHIVVDTSAWQQLQEVSEVLKKTQAVKVVIDHHLSSDDLGAELFKDVSAAAAGVLVTEFIEASGDSFSLPQATALFAAIATDTGWYRFSNVDSRTLAAAARLVDRGVEPHLIYRELYERSSLARLKLHSVVLGRVTLSCQNKVAHTLVTRQDFVETGALPTDTEELVNECLTVEGTEAAFILVEQPDGRIKGSLRSRSRVSVASIAEQFGGGGHRQAAGVMLPGPILSAQSNLIHAFEEQLKMVADSPVA
jgi:Exopolyphosphatase-related proteins